MQTHTMSRKDDQAVDASNRRCKGDQLFLDGPVGGGPSGDAGGAFAGDGWSPLPVAAGGGGVGGESAVGVAWALVLASVGPEVGWLAASCCSTASELFFAAKARCLNTHLGVQKNSPLFINCWPRPSCRLQNVHTRQLWCILLPRT
ncbi:hypothetical protein T11_14522 [Trichinella zimbabwensis]|uniref:Uncharacterized protein n=1 Tax=Trichinella zimbabwensis TaxID=268475 RepID=A0A0V1H1U8_9BILA|nr:hypothetical protein T11_14522 [Trichinella zimbabwensis]